MSPSSLWAVTAYFNPMRYRSRQENFRIFRRRLSAPLLAIELSFDGRFELGEDDADLVVRRVGGDILWQKERLLNLGLASLPPECESVAFLDCDILFGRDDWSERACELLERYPIVQPFSRANYLRRDWSPATDPSVGIEITRHSAAFAISLPQGGTALLQGVNEHGRSLVSPGLAWVFRRDLIEEHGLYEGCIAGGGDFALACAAWGVLDTVVRHQLMNARQESFYLDWAQPFSAAVQGRVGCAEGDLFHLWHGSLGDRQARERHRALRRFEFNPFLDVASDAGGCWRWSSDKLGLHAYLRNYFCARKEDG